MEQLKLEWLDYSENIKPSNPITVYADTSVMQDLDGIRSKFGPFLSYYEYMGLIQKQTIQNSVEIDNIKITIIPVPIDKAVSIFVFESNGKKLIYAPCDCKPFPNNELLSGADILVIGDTIVGDVLKNGKTLSVENPLRQELHSFEDVLNIKEHLGINRVVITHIEECWGKTYDDYSALEKEYENVKFAFDGMIIDLS